jgi:hypothetical protein
MKRISEMNLAQLADEVEDGGIFSEYEVAHRLREIHAEYERRWKNLSVAQRIDAIAYPPDPNSLSNLFLRFMDSAEKEIAELEKQLAWHKMTESERIESIAIDGTEGVKRRARERKEKRKQILEKLKGLKK